MKKLFTALLALCMLFSFFSVPAGASSVSLITPPGSGVTMQTMPAHSSNYGYLLSNGSIYNAPDGSVIATVTADDLMLYDGQGGRNGSDGRLWIRVVGGGKSGYVPVNNFTFLTSGEEKAYWEMMNPQPTPTPTVAPAPTPTPLVTLITPYPYPTARPTTAPSNPVSRAYVNTASGSLNMRSWPSYNAGIVLRIPQYAWVDVYEYSGGWARVRYAGYEGWVVSSFLSSGGYSPVTTPTPKPTYSPVVVQGYAYVSTSSGGLNLREYASSSARVMMVIPRYARVEVISYGSTWCYVRYNGAIGYVMTKFLSYSYVPQPTVAPTYTPTYGGWAVVKTESGGLNMREASYVGARILTVIPRNASVQVLQYGSTWSRVQYGGQTGYVMTGFLSFTGQGGAVTSTRAIVTASGTGLKLRETASTSGRVLATIPGMTEVRILSRGDRWTRVSWSGLTGYVMTSYLTFLPN